MRLRLSRLWTAAGVMAALSASTAQAQFWCCPTVCCPPPVCVRPAYTQVPVTELREVRQVVHKPVTETKYVDQSVTEYRQVVENKTAEIPTISYQNVTEMHTVQRDYGHWQTQWRHRPKMHPCQYDGRPDLFGLINRTGYSLRMAFTPEYYGERMYVPNVVAQQVPVTRQVAVRGTQTINYQVARVVPYTTTRKVAVNTVRMVAEEVVTKRPVTVMKSIPWGSAYAYGAPLGGSTTTTALQPTPDPRTSATAVLPKDTQPSPATDRSAKAVDKLRDQPEDIEEDTRESDASESTIRNRASGSYTPKSPATKNPAQPVVLPARAEQVAALKPAARPLGKWVARKKPALDGPSFPEMTLAQTVQKSG